MLCGQLQQTILGLALAMIDNTVPLMVGLFSTTIFFSLHFTSVTQSTALSDPHGRGIKKVTVVSGNIQGSFW